MRRRWRGLVEGLGPVGIFPLAVLLGLSTVERFDAFAFGVLAPEIRHTFHLSNAGFLSIVSLTAALPILLSVPIGYLGDRLHRVRITQVAGAVWGITAILTGLAPAVFVLVLARMLGGAGLLVNESVHPSLLADYYPPTGLPRVMGIHRQAFVLGAFGSPIAGVLTTLFGWRTAFVILALPTFLLVLIARWMREPARGATLAVPPPPGDDKVGWAEAFRRLRSIRPRSCSAAASCRSRPSSTPSSTTCTARVRSSAASSPSSPAWAASSVSCSARGGPRSSRSNVARSGFR